MSAKGALVSTGWWATTEAFHLIVSATQPGFPLAKPCNMPLNPLDPPVNMNGCICRTASRSHTVASVSWNVRCRSLGGRAGAFDERAVAAEAAGGLPMRVSVMLIADLARSPLRTVVLLPPVVDGHNSFFAAGGGYGRGAGLMAPACCGMLNERPVRMACRVLGLGCLDPEDVELRWRASPKRSGDWIISAPRNFRGLPSPKSKARGPGSGGRGDGNAANEQFGAFGEWGTGAQVADA